MMDLVYNNNNLPSPPPPANMGPHSNYEVGAHKSSSNTLKIIFESRSIPNPLDHSNSLFELNNFLCILWSFVNEMEALHEVSSQRSSSVNGRNMQIYPYDKFSYFSKWQQLSNDTCQLSVTHILVVRVGTTLQRINNVHLSFVHKAQEIRGQPCKDIQCNVV